MLRRPWFFVLLFIALAISSPAQQVNASHTGGPTSLDAPWRLHFGDDPAYAQPGFNDSQWTLHRIDKDWASEGHKGYSGYAWYRMRVILPKSDEPLAIGIYTPAQAVEVYIDGNLAGTIGRMRPKPVWTYYHAVAAIAVPAALHGRSVEVALRVWEPIQEAPYQGEGAAAHPPLLGTAGDVERIVDLSQQNRWTAEIPNWAVDMLGLAVGLFSLGLFLLQRHAREYAYAALFFCGFAAENLCVWILHQTGTSVAISAGVQFVAGSALLCMWLLFTWEFIRARADRLLYACLTAAWTQAIGSSLINLGVGRVAVYSWVNAAMYLFFAIAVFVRLYTLARRGNRDAQLFLVPFSLWALDNCLISILWALGSSGKAWYLNSAWVVLYHGPRFDITWSNVLVLLFNLAVGAVLVLRYARSAQQEQRLLTEMESARVVQQILVPEEVPELPGFVIESVYRPASQVGGDFFQILPTKAGGVLAVIGDVSGKGVPAAMIVSLLVGTVRTLAEGTDSPAELLDGLNRRLIGRSSGFTTCMILRANPDGTVVVANAGHLPPYVNGREVEVETGLVLGISADASYEETVLHLEDGARLTLFTDGVVEARSRTGELYGFERAAAVAGAPAAQIAAEAQAFGQEDDITVVSVTRAVALQTVVA